MGDSNRRAGRPLLGPLPAGAGHEPTGVPVGRSRRRAGREDARGVPPCGDRRGVHQKLEKPRAFAREVGARLGEYLARALSYHAALTGPEDLAWLLASYARDGLSRVDAAEEAALLEPLRTAVEEALGIQFEGERGKRFFHSALVQTLFYGIFSAWVLWARSSSAEDRSNGGRQSGICAPRSWLRSSITLRVRAACNRLVL